MSSLIDNTTPEPPQRPRGEGGAKPTSGKSGARPDGPLPRLVRYGAMAWVGEFTYRGQTPLPWGGRVVIQTERGIELGEYIGPACARCAGESFLNQVRSYTQASGPEFCRSRAGRILRLANEQDRNEQRHLDAHVQEDIRHCVERAHAHKLDLRVVTAEHLLGGERIIFYFSAPQRVDFRQLVRELAQHHRTRIEMRQVGARDEARLVADFEICGRECCCRNFLKRLRPVNMKMAKLQKSTLDPSKVSGRCGRLRCCLRYEHEGYEELAARLPRVGSRVDTAHGPGKVVDRQLLTLLVAVQTDDNRLVTVPLEEIKAFNLPPAAPPSPVATPPTAGPPKAATASPPPTRPDEHERERRPRRRRRGRRPPDGSAPAAPPRGDAPAPSPAKSHFEPEGPMVEPTAPSSESSHEHPPRNEQPANEQRSARRGRRRRRRRKPDGGTPPAHGATD